MYTFIRMKENFAVQYNINITDDAIQKEFSVAQLLNNADTRTPTINMSNKITVRVQVARPTRSLNISTRRTLVVLPKVRLANFFS